MGKSGGGRIVLGGEAWWLSTMDQASVTGDGFVLVSVGDRVKTGREMRNQSQVWVAWVGKFVVGSIYVVGLILSVSFHFHFCPFEEDLQINFINIRSLM